MKFNSGFYQLKSVTLTNETDDSVMIDSIEASISLEYDMETPSDFTSALTVASNGVSARDIQSVMHTKLNAQSCTITVS